MNQSLKQQLLRYWLAMNAGAIQAGAHSARAFFAVAGAHAAIDSVPALNLQQLGAVFLLGFGSSILSYLDAHPLPMGEVPSSKFQVPSPTQNQAGSAGAPTVNQTSTEPAKAGNPNT